MNFKFVPAKIFYCGTMSAPDRRYVFKNTLPVLQETGSGLIWRINGGDKKKSCTFIAFFESKYHCLTLPNNRIHGCLRRMGALLVMIILTGAGSYPLVAQQTSLITQYMFSNMEFNPAYAGSSGGICATGLVRQQWIGFKDPDGSKTAPQLYMLTVDAPIKVLHGGVGGSIFQDQLGFFKTIAMKLGYAYRMDAGPGELSIGLQVSLQNGSYDFSKLRPIDENDPLLTGQTGKSGDMIFDANFGLFYKVPDKYYIGLSAENLLQSRGKTTHYQLRRTYYLTGGYQWEIPNHPAFQLRPSALLQYDGGTFQVNLSALVMYNNKFYGGLGYRYQDAVSVLAGLNIKGLQVGLAYDICTSTLSKYNSGSLEVLVSYCFRIDTDKFRRTYRNTRFL